MIDQEVISNGYTFTLCYAFERHADMHGIRFRPDDANPNDPQWVDALKDVIELYTTVLPLYHLREIDSYGDPRYLSASYFKLIAELVQQIRQSDYEYTPDELAFVERMANVRPTAPEQPARQEVSTPGYVYLLQSPSGAYKIGRTKNPQHRRSTFQVKLPFEVEFIALIKTDDMYGLEGSLHERYADKRINGEWFELEPEDIEYIKSLQGE